MGDYPHAKKQVNNELLQSIKEISHLECHVQEDSLQQRLKATFK